MKLTVNAAFLRKPGTGIGQVTTHGLDAFLSVLSDEERSQVCLYGEEAQTLADFAAAHSVDAKAWLPLWKRDDLLRKLLWEGRSVAQQTAKDSATTHLSLYQCPTITAKNIRHIMIVHDIVPELFSAYQGNARQRRYWQQTVHAVQSADSIVAVSESTRQDLIERIGIAAEKITVIPIAVDPQFYEPASREECARVQQAHQLPAEYLYYGGGLEQRKNVDGVLRAYKILKERGASVPPLVLSGRLLPGVPLAIDVEQLVHDLGLTDSVHILGFVPQEDLPALYRLAACFVFPSHYEGFGMPVVEALLQGTRVVTADNSSLREVAGDAAWYCDSTSDTSIAQAVQEALASEDAERRIQGQQHAAMFQWSTFAAALRELIF